MNDYTKQAAIRTAAESIFTALSPLRMDGESPEETAIRCIRRYRGDNSNANTRRQCRAFFDIFSRHFIGFKDAEEQKAAIIRNYPPSCRDKARAELEVCPELIQAFYRVFMGEALFLAYRQAISQKAPHILLASHIGQPLEVYMEQRGDIFLTYFQGQQIRADLYRGEERHRAEDAYCDFIQANIERKD